MLYTIKEWLVISYYGIIGKAKFLLEFYLQSRYPRVQIKTHILILTQAQNGPK
jgi:hypothetical protein